MSSNPVSSTGESGTKPPRERRLLSGASAVRHPAASLRVPSWGYLNRYSVSDKGYRSGGVEAEPEGTFGAPSGSPAQATPRLPIAAVCDRGCASLLLIRCRPPRSCATPQTVSCFFRAFARLRGKRDDLDLQSQDGIRFAA
jgi:hypothetical protein